MQGKGTLRAIFCKKYLNTTAGFKTIMKNKRPSNMHFSNT